MACEQPHNQHSSFFPKGHLALDDVHTGSWLASHLTISRLAYKRPPVAYG